MKLEQVAFELAWYEYNLYQAMKAGNDESKDFWLAKYAGAAKIIELIFGEYPACLEQKDGTFNVYIGDYKANVKVA